jgi:D-tyrosyl-tRNA(Tyr) deacylase
MKVVLQRVREGYVAIEGEKIAQIGRGYVLLVGIMEGDGVEDAEALVRKIVNLRLFPDDCAKPHYNIVQIGGEVLAVSQFTLAARTKKGNRPDFTQAMAPAEAKRLYELFCEKLRAHVPLQTGRFGAMMDVGLINDGPFTILLDSGELLGR